MRLVDLFGVAGADGGPKSPVAELVLVNSSLGAERVCGGPPDVGSGGRISGGFDWLTGDSFL